MLFMLVGRGGGMLFILAFAAATLPREELLHPTTGWLGWASNWKVSTSNNKMAQQQSEQVLKQEVLKPKVYVGANP
jgi:hypothetical protein